MLTLRARLFIIISVVVFLILGISIGLLFLRRSQNKPEVTPPVVVETGDATTTNSLPLITTPVKTPVENSVPTGLQVKERTPEEVTQNGVKQYAKIFIERYATYSTDSNFQNIRDVEGLVTPRFWRVLSPQLATTPATGSFTGVTTQVVMVSILNWQNTLATVELKTKQMTTKGTSPAATTYVTYKVKMEKLANAWLVDSVEITP